MKNPCKECLVTAMCTRICSKWFDWAIKLVPIDTYMDMDKFNELNGSFGPFKNYYPVKYDMHKIKFEDKDSSHERRVCIKLK